MRVPDVVRECVCFVMERTPSDDYRPIGTAFLVTMTSDVDESIAFYYVVTARHVIAGAIRRSHEFVYLRLNTLDGGFNHVQVPVDRWRFSTDDTEADDVAVLGWAPDRDRYAYKVLDVEGFASEAQLRDHDVGIGDEVFLPGLFVSHVGRERNLPIVRMGAIAAMPEEPVASRIGALRAYLVEARSIGGLSGSPVFVNIGLLRLPKGAMLISTRSSDEPEAPIFLLLGLMHGHFDVTVPRATDQGGPITDEAVNMGIGIVVPADRVLRLIREHPDFIEQRASYRPAP